MQAPASITTPAAYIAALTEPRRSEIQALHDAIVRAAPALTPCIVSGMIGFGPYRYRHESGREGDTATVVLASQKNHISVYVMATDANGSLAEQHKDRLGKVSVGKSCIRFKKLADVDLPTLLRLVQAATRLHPANGPANPDGAGV